MNQLLPQYLSVIRSEHGRKTAFRFFEQGAPVSVTYEQFVLDVMTSAAVFEKYRGRHIALLARNSYAYIVNLFGIMAAGAAAVALNVEERWAVLKTQMETVGIDLLLHDGEYAEEEPELSRLYADRMLLLSAAACVKEPLSPLPHNDPEDFSLMLFTSGTASVSKGVMQSAHSLVAVAEAFAVYFASTAARLEADPLCFYLCLPLYHAFALSSLLGCISCGHTVAVNSKKSLFRKELSLLGCNCASMVPSMLQILAKDLKRGRWDYRLTDLLVAGAPCSSEMAELFQRNGIRVALNYGMSENMAVSTNQGPFPQKAGSVGTVIGDTQVAIKDGEILVRGHSMMLGYYNNPEATAQVIRDGWLHTGDLGYLDEDGYLYITGRKKNLIILSTGENVSPEELESLLLHDPDILETVVIEKGNRICARIYAAADKQEEIRRFVDEVNKQVAIYKRINLIEFRAEPFPRTASGKIKRT